MSDAPTPTGATRSTPLPDDEISLWEVLAVLVRRRTTIVLATVLVSALAVAVALLGADSYTTVATFRPQGAEASTSQLMTLAGQFGVSVPGAQLEEASPQFYAELLESREILSRVAADTYRVEPVGGAVRLADLLEIEEDTEELRQERVIKRLREKMLTVSVAGETGTVSVEVVTEWPDLSAAIADRLLEEVTLFNLDTRQSQAAAERKFIAARVDSAQHELREAEDALRSFLESNRLIEGAPLLEMEYQRLNREVLRRESVLTGLLQSLEQARIAEVRDTPVITVLQEPFLPPGPDERRLVLAAALGIVLGGMAGVVMAFVIEAVRRPAEGDPAREDFRESWEGLVRSIPLVGKRRG